MLKFIAFLSIIRWYSIGLTMLAQYLAVFITLNSIDQWKVVIADPNLHLIVLSTALITAAGFIINAFYDLEKDLINRPNRTVFDRLISKKSCLNIYILLSLLGLFLAYMASFNIFIYFSLYAIGLWFYSHKLQKIALLGEISASLLTVSSFFSIGLYYHHFRYIYFIYGSWVMFVVFGRELVKGILDIKGDAIFGYNSIPLAFGLQSSKSALMAMGLLSLLPLSYLYYQLGPLNYGIWLILNAFITLDILRLLAKIESPAEFKSVNFRYKILIVSAVLGVIML